MANDSAITTSSERQDGSNKTHPARFLLFEFAKRWRDSDAKLTPETTPQESFFLLCTCTALSYAVFGLLYLAIVYSFQSSLPPNFPEDYYKSPLILFIIFVAVSFPFVPASLINQTIDQVLAGERKPEEFWRSTYTSLVGAYAAAATIAIGLSQNSNAQKLDELRQSHDNKIMGIEKQLISLREGLEALDVRVDVTETKIDSELKAFTKDSILALQQIPPLISAVGEAIHTDRMFVSTAREQVRSDISVLRTYKQELLHIRDEVIGAESEHVAIHARINDLEQQLSIYENENLQTEKQFNTLFDCHSKRAVEIIARRRGRNIVQKIGDVVVGDGSFKQMVDCITDVNDPYAERGATATLDDSAKALPKADDATPASTSAASAPG